MKTAALALIAILMASAACDSEDTCSTSAPINCSLERSSAAACSAQEVCGIAQCGASGTCCYCEDGDWKSLQVSCGACSDAGIDGPDAAAVDAP